MARSPWTLDEEGDDGSVTGSFPSGPLLGAGRQLGLSGVSEGVGPLFLCPPSLRGSPPKVP